MKNLQNMTCELIFVLFNYSRFLTQWFLSLNFIVPIVRSSINEKVRVSRTIRRINMLAHSKKNVAEYIFNKGSILIETAFVLSREIQTITNWRFSNYNN